MAIESSSKGAFTYDLAHLRGQPVTEFLVSFCDYHPEVTGLHFAAYTPEPKLSERLGNMLTPEEQDLRDAAVNTCHGNGIPFYDALFGIAMKREGIPPRFLETAAAHNSDPPTLVYDLTRTNILTPRILDIIRQLPDGFGLVVSSKVRLATESTAQIPMLDFRCPCSPGNARAIRKVLSLLGKRHGVIVESGRSYHFYGTCLMTMPEWTNFMAHALLFAPFVDPRYVAHRIADGECRLKLAADKKADIPRITDIYANGD